jgi:RNA polymerase sigma-70 factor, ECF subfamily
VVKATSTEAGHPVAAPAVGGEAHDFDAVYTRWFARVVSWVRALGTPDSDMEDVAQEIFIVVRRKLPAFDGRNLPGWLYRITSWTVSDQRRRAWFKNLFQRRGAVSFEEVAAAGPAAADEAEQIEARRLLRQMLARLSQKNRVAFVLFEMEDHSCDEIAALLGVSQNTVTMRVHHARKAMRAMAEKIRRGEAL